MKAACVTLTAYYLEQWIKVKQNSGGSSRKGEVQRMGINLEGAELIAKPESMAKGGSRSGTDT